MRITVTIRGEEYRIVVRNAYEWEPDDDEFPCELTDREMQSIDQAATTAFFENRFDILDEP